MAEFGSRSIAMACRRVSLRRGEGRGFHISQWPSGVTLRAEASVTGGLRGKRFGIKAWADVVMDDTQPDDIFIYRLERAILRQIGLCVVGGVVCSDRLRLILLEGAVAGVPVDRRCVTILRSRSS